MPLENRGKLNYYAAYALLFNQIFIPNNLSDVNNWRSHE